MENFKPCFLQLREIMGEKIVNDTKNFRIQKKSSAFKVITQMKKQEKDKIKDKDRLVSITEKDQNKKENYIPKCYDKNKS